MPLQPHIRLLALAAITTMAIVVASPASAYAVVCKRGQFDIDSRDEAQLRIAFGTSYCTFRRFSYRTDAENFARNNGMQPGRPCSCR